MQCSMLCGVLRSFMQIYEQDSYSQAVPQSLGHLTPVRALCRAAAALQSAR